MATGNDEAPSEKVCGRRPDPHDRGISYPAEETAAKNAEDVLARFKIGRELLEAAGVRHANDCEVRELLGIHGRPGQDLSGIVFPNLDPRDERVLGHRVRLDRPFDGQKYLSTQGCRALFFPPNCGSELSDLSAPAVIVEAEKSALALAALSNRSGRKMLPIAVGGVWGWKRRNGVELTPDGNREPVTAPSPSLDLVCWTGRKVVIALDSNVAGRRDLAKARLALGEELAKRGAQVFFASVPAKQGVNGPDDLIATVGDKAALEMLNRAAPFSIAKPAFILTHLSELLARPDVPVEYVWESRLVAGTVSVVVSKPKVGKSTFARNLCLCVSRGEDFLGLKTKQGECIYLALEEREADIRDDFRAMGANGTEPIYVHAASAPAEGIHALCDLVKQRRPVLVVVDPLFRLAHIKDEKVYADTYAELGPFIDTARETGAHVALIHHAGKGEKADPVDSPLGSTGIGGVACTIVVLKRRETYRTVQTVQRIGQEMPETVLKFSPEKRALTLGPEKSEADALAISEAILEYLKSVGEPKTEPEIVEAVEGGRTGPKRSALRRLVDQGKVEREGSGKRGDPYKYSFSFSCSQDIAGTRERETEKGAETRINTADILVPDSSPDSILVPAQQDYEKPFEEGEL